MAWLTDNLSILLIIIGIALLAVEVGVFGFSVAVEALEENAEQQRQPQHAGQERPDRP
jgi:uncharacterized membrane protein